MVDNIAQIYLDIESSFFLEQLGMTLSSLEDTLGIPRERSMLRFLRGL